MASSAHLPEISTTPQYLIKRNILLSRSCCIALRNLHQHVHSLNVSQDISPRVPPLIGTSRKNTLRTDMEFMGYRNPWGSTQLQSWWPKVPRRQFRSPNHPGQCRFEFRNHKRLRRHKIDLSGRLSGGVACGYCDLDRIQRCKISGYLSGILSDESLALSHHAC